MFETQSLIFSGLSQFILGFSASLALVLYLGRVILTRHDERHTATEKALEQLRKNNDDMRDRLTALESAHNERGAQCRKALTSRKRTSKS